MKSMWLYRVATFCFHMAASQNLSFFFAFDQSSRLSFPTNVIQFSINYAEMHSFPPKCQHHIDMWQHTFIKSRASCFMACDILSYNKCMRHLFSSAVSQSVENKCCSCHLQLLQYEVRLHGGIKQNRIVANIRITRQAAPGPGADSISCLVGQDFLDSWTHFLAEIFFQHWKPQTLHNIITVLHCIASIACLACISIYHP